LAKKRTNQGARESQGAVTPKKNWLLDILQDRQAAASAIGACLLLAMFLFLVVAIFLGMIKPDVIVSAFTLILGYFFGHIASR